MPRKPLILSSEAPYHISVRSNNRDWFQVPLEDIWFFFSECLINTQSLFSCDYYAFVLMNNHFHLLMGTPKANLGEAMRHLLTEASRRIARASNRINKIFGARYRWTILHDPQAFAYVLKYDYRNPVRAGICDSVLQYPYSTLNRLDAGVFKMPMCDRIDGISRLIPREKKELVTWLDKPTPKEAEALVKKGLRRFEFKFTTDNKYQKDLRILKEAYGVETI